LDNGRGSLISLTIIIVYKLFAYTVHRTDVKLSVVAKFNARKVNNNVRMTWEINEELMVTYLKGVNG
jgi:hypothetical protein